jgi:hypothetical protein
MTFSNAMKSTVAISLLLCLGVVACKALFSLEGHGTVLGQTGEVKITYDGRDVQAEKLPASNRADVKFFDANGRELAPGASGVAQGDRVPVPQGATHCEVSGASSANSCTGCAPPSGGGGGGGGGMVAGDLAFDSPVVEPWGSARESADFEPAGPAPCSEKWVYVFTLDPDIDGSTVWGNVSGSFTVAGSPSAAQIHAAIAAILSGGHGTPVPGNVNVDTFVRILPEQLGGRMFIADQTEAFTSMSMSWNGSNYAALGMKPVSNYAAANGWKVIELFIPMTDFHITPGGGSVNSMDLLWTTAEDKTTNEMRQGIAYF